MFGIYTIFCDDRLSMKSFIMFLIPLIIISFVSFGEETDKLKHTIFLGNNAPIDSNDGLSTLFIYYNYKSEPESDRPFFEFTLQTSEILVDFKTSTETVWNFGYGAMGEVVSEGFGMDIYVAGERKKEITFYGDSLGAYVAVGYEINKNWLLNWRFLIEQARFYDNEFTGEKFQLPSDFSTRLNTLNLSTKNAFAMDDSIFEARLESGLRYDWDDWQLEDDYKSVKSYYKEKFSLTLSRSWDRIGKSKLKLSAAIGQNLDLFSGYRLGGLPGEYSVSGFFRNEFRAREVYITNLSHMFEFTEHKKLLLFYDYAFFKRLDMDYLESTPDSDSIQGLALGFYFGIESLAGLPIIARIGQGIGVPDQELRRELMIGVAAKF